MGTRIRLSRDTDLVAGRLETVLTRVGVWALAAITLAPLVLIVLAAFTPANDLISGFAIPTQLTFNNFGRAWDQGNFGTYLQTSVIVTAAVVALVAALSIPCGYALGILRPTGGRLFLALFVLGLIIPEEVLIIPLYYQMLGFGLLNTYWALILPETALSLPFGVYWMWGFFRNVPRALWESAQLDGASSLRILWSILLPIARPAILTLLVLTTVWNWNEFYIPLVMVTSDSLRTAPVGLANFQSLHGQVDISGEAAAALIVALPILCVYVLLQRRIIAGITSGAIRG